MLIEFRVENYRSLRDEQSFTMEAGRVGDAADKRPRTAVGHDEPLLPAAVIYGANASGKSNVMSAIAFMRTAVVFSQRLWEPEGGVPRTAFAWCGKRLEPSMFEATFLVDGVKYAYGFVVDDQAVQEEWLFAWPHNRKQLWLERDRQTFKFGEHMHGPNDSVRTLTRPNALFLSAAAQQGHPSLLPLYSWFRNIFVSANSQVRRLAPYDSQFVASKIFSLGEQQPTLFPLNDDEEENRTSHVRQLLQAADIGIVDVRSIVVERQVDGRRQRRSRILLQHQAGDDDSWLELDDESDGTKTLFALAPAIFQALEKGGLLLIDELEASLHPLLGLAILRLFNEPRSNPHDAQILFTTHDTNLLGTTLGDPPLRRDQIWFTEKDADGASKIYPLTDYKPRKAENLERGYLQGRYGAVPFLGQLDRITE